MAADSTEDLQPGTATSLSAAEQRLLPTMPLHAITSVHGEAGLRERLLLEIVWFPVADRARVEGAVALASRLHTGNAVGLFHTTGPEAALASQEVPPAGPGAARVRPPPGTPRSARRSRT
jgi:hypothetical protein